MPPTRSQSTTINDQIAGVQPKYQGGAKKKRSQAITTTASRKKKAGLAMSITPSSATPLEFNISYKAPSTLCSNDSIRGAMRGVPVSYFRRNNTSTSTDCSICCSELEASIVCTTVCNHYFHRECLEKSLQHGTKCPICRTTITVAPQGKCPDATMRARIIRNPLAPTADYIPTPALIQVDYSIPSGNQSSFHDAPGRRFHGTQRTAFLDTTVESQWLLQRLRYAFSKGLTFTVGTSLTTGQPNQITWTSIHHKTNLGVGRPFALPDAGYIVNCNEELDALHVPTGPECLREW